LAPKKKKKPDAGIYPRRAWLCSGKDMLGKRYQRAECDHKLYKLSLLCLFLISDILLLESIPSAQKPSPPVPAVWMGWTPTKQVGRARFRFRQTATFLSRRPAQDIRREPPPIRFRGIQWRGATLEAKSINAQRLFDIASTVKEPSVRGRLSPRKQGRDFVTKHHALCSLRRFLE
jgi:hypothetical protein